MPVTDIRDTCRDGFLLLEDGDHNPTWARIDTIVRVAATKQGAHPSMVELDGAPRGYYAGLEPEAIMRLVAEHREPKPIAGSPSPEPVVERKSRT